MSAQFEESKHPRGGKGTESGGKFVSKGEGAGASAPAKTDPTMAVRTDEMIAQRKEYKAKIGVSKQANTDLSAYQGGWYGSVNAKLRAGSKGPMSEGLGRTARRMVESIDSIFSGVEKSGGTPEEMHVFRGASLGIDSNFDKVLAGLRPGHLLFDEGFSSASLDQGTAEAFANKGGATKGYLFQIRVPKGSSAFKPNDITGERPDEQEVLLNRAGNGAAFKVVSIQKGPSVTKVMVDYEWNPE